MAELDNLVGSAITMSAEGYRGLVNCEQGRNLHWTTDVNVELPIKMNEDGLVQYFQPSTIGK